MYTSIPDKAIRPPATHMKSDRPTDPDNEKMDEGVAKIPVPTMRLKIRKTAETVPICRRELEVVYTSPDSGSAVVAFACTFAGEL